MNVPEEMESIAAPLENERSRQDEVEVKLERLRDLMVRERLSSVLLTRPGAVSWVTAGVSNPIIRGSDDGMFAWVLVTGDAAFVVTQNVEAPRLDFEERVGELGFEVLQHPWYAADRWLETVGTVAGSSVGADSNVVGRDIAADVTRLRLPLLAPEHDRLRELGLDAVDAVEGALSLLQPGEREREVAARVAAGCERRGIVPSVLLVGSDERMRRFRHCPPTDSVIEREAMVVIVGVRKGLNVACTRIAAIGSADRVLAERQGAACAVEAAMIAATRPGATYGDALQAGIDAYESCGWPGEHEHHYQGGPIGYDIREFGPAPLARPDRWTKEVVPAGSAVAWNPTIQGGKSEDTYLITDAGSELLTPAGSWPTRELTIGGAKYVRAGILEV